MTDGPFVETKEIVGGYALVEVASKADAVDLARQFVELHRVHWPDFECACLRHDMRPSQLDPLRQC